MVRSQLLQQTAKLAALGATQTDEMGDWLLTGSCFSEPKRCSVIAIVSSSMVVKTSRGDTSVLMISGDCSERETNGASGLVCAKA